jgi:hypothetical protein
MLEGSITTTIQNLCTQSKQDARDRNLERWNQHLHIIGIHDNPDLQGYHIHTKWTIAQCFIHSIRTGTFGKGRHKDAVVYNNKKQVLGRSIRQTIGQLATTFRRRHWTSPFHEEGSYKSMDRAIEDQFAAYESEDLPLIENKPSQSNT